jgi:hypothetical protein
MAKNFETDLLPRIRRFFYSLFFKICESAADKKICGSAANKNDQSSSPAKRKRKAISTLLKKQS